MFDLIANVGEDCAGAVQFVSPERVGTLIAESRGSVQWLDDSALAIHPTKKYPNEGGPSTESALALIRDHSLRSLEDDLTFANSPIFIWLIAGTLAHAKHYSELHAGQGRIRLAPLYDIASILPYPNVDLPRAKLAMKIGGKYRIRDIGPRQWIRFAKDNRLPKDEVRDRVQEMARRLPDEASSLAKDLANAGLKHPINSRLVSASSSRSIEVRRECTFLSEVED